MPSGVCTVKQGLTVPASWPHAHMHTIQNACMSTVYTVYVRTVSLIALLQSLKGPEENRCCSSAGLNPSKHNDHACAACLPSIGVKALRCSLIMHQVPVLLVPREEGEWLNGDNKIGPCVDKGPHSQRRSFPWDYTGHELELINQSISMSRKRVLWNWMKYWGGIIYVLLSWVEIFLMFWNTLITKGAGAYLPTLHCSGGIGSVRVSVGLAMLCHRFASQHGRGDYLMLWHSGTWLQISYQVIVFSSQEQSQEKVQHFLSFNKLVDADGRKKKLLWLLSHCSWNPFSSVTIAEWPPYLGVHVLLYWSFWRSGESGCVHDQGAYVYVCAAVLFFLFNPTVTDVGSDELSGQDRIEKVEVMQHISRMKTGHISYISLTTWLFHTKHAIYIWHGDIMIKRNIKVVEMGNAQSVWQCM